MSWSRRIAVRVAVLPLKLSMGVVTAIGVASLVAWLVAGELAGPDQNLWFRAFRTFGMKTAVTFLSSGLAAIILVSLPRSSFLDEEPTGSWLTALPAALIAFPLLALAASSRLLLLWKDAYLALEALGVWKDVPKAFASQYGGLVLWPLVPAGFLVCLELGPAFCLVVNSGALLVLLYWQREAFSRYLLAALLVQFAFAAGIFCLLGLTTEITGLLLGELRSAGAGEEVRAAMEPWILRHQDAVKQAAPYFGGLCLASIVWTPVLFLRK